MEAIVIDMSELLGDTYFIPKTDTENLKIYQQELLN